MAGADNTGTKASKRPRAVAAAEEGGPGPAAAATKAEGTGTAREAAAVGDVYEWWNDPEVQSTAGGNAGTRGAIKWKASLTHNAVLFAPEYTPHGLPIHYLGQPFAMTAEEEELATQFATSRTIEQYQREAFRGNFFRAFRQVLAKRAEPHPIKRLEYCNFDAIWEWHCQGREARLERSREEKKSARAATEAENERFKYAVLDGRRELLTGYRVEPPGLFRGRGEHPKQGMPKARVTPEDIVLNIGPNDAPPPPPPGHHWKQIVSLPDVMWVATWQDKVTGSFKYVQFASQSSMKGMSDRNKFEKARELRGHVNAIREAYTKAWDSPDRVQRQLGVAIYFIDKLALRCGTEKSEDEADTVGCCSLRYEHVVPLEGGPRCTLRFDFLGKDSVRYENDVDVAPRVYQLVRQFREGKAGLRKEQQMLFDGFGPSDLNAHLKSFMPGLSAKVFRTFNASKCLVDQLVSVKVPRGATDAQKKVIFNDANKAVAVLCNHQKAVSKGHGAGMARLAAQIAALEEAKRSLRRCAAAEDQEAAARQFYEEEDRRQLAWIEAYGTDADKAKYDKVVESRATIVDSKAKRRPASASGSGSSGTKKKKSSRGSGSNGKTIGSEEDDEDEEDVPLGRLFGTRAPVAKGGAASVQKQKAAAGKKKASPSKGQKKKAAAGKKKTSPSKGQKKKAAAGKKKTSPSKGQIKKDTAGNKKTSPSKEKIKKDTTDKKKTSPSKEKIKNNTAGKKKTGLTIAKKTTTTKTKK